MKLTNFCLDISTAENANLCLIPRQNRYKQAFFQMGCTHSVDTRPIPAIPTPQPLQPTPRIPTHSSAPIRFNLQTEGCRKEVHVLKNFIYEIKKPISISGKKGKVRHTSSPLKTANQTLDPSSIVILLQSKIPLAKRLSEQQNQRQTSRCGHLYDNRIPEDLSDAVGISSLHLFQQLCDGCYTKLPKFIPKGSDRRRQCCYCSGFGITNKWFPPDSQPKCQKPMCFKRGWDKVRSLLLCSSCQGSGRL